MGMKAILIESHGGPEKLLYKEVSLPTIGPEEVLVRVRTCGLNHVDLFVREGKLPVSITLPRIPGMEITGEVAETGDGVKDFQKGDRVVVMSRMGCLVCEYCKAGEENLCAKSRSIGMNVDGGYAEYVAAPARNLVAIPAGVSFNQAAGASLSALTAWHMLITRAGLKRGDDVLVLAGGSSVGSFAIQIAKGHGARVFTTVGSEEKGERAMKLGADAVILHRKQDIAEEVKRLTGKRGVDIVFEHVGERTWEKSIASLARNGRLVTCGAHTGKNGSLDIWKLFSKQLSVIGAYYGTKSELVEVLRFMGEGRMSTVIHASFPLHASREAHEVLENRKNFGKVILEV